MSGPLASIDDLSAIWRDPADDAEITRCIRLIAVASTELRQVCPFNIDDRIALFAVTPTPATALNPLLVANVVATIVKRVLVNPDGLASSSESVGPYSKTQSFVNRSEQTDTQGSIRVIPADIDRLRPASPTQLPRSVALSPSDRMNAQLMFGPGYRFDPLTGAPVGRDVDPVTGEPLAVYPPW